MAEILIAALSALVLLAGLSVYSALRLAKRTDEMVACMDKDDNSDAPLIVRFPDSVFSRNPERHVTTPNS